MTSEENVTVNLKDGSVYSVNIEDREEDSSPYEVFAFLKAKKVDDADDGDTYIVKVKNNSSKSLGNITLKIGEINSLYTIQIFDTSNFAMFSTLFTTTPLKSLVYSSNSLICKALASYFFTNDPFKSTSPLFSTLLPLHPTNPIIINIIIISTDTFIIFFIYYAPHTLHLF